MQILSRLHIHSYPQNSPCGYEWHNQFQIISISVESSSVYKVEPLNCGLNFGGEANGR